MKGVPITKRLTHLQKVAVRAALERAIEGRGEIAEVKRARNLIALFDDAHDVEVTDMRYDDRDR